MCYLIVDIYGHTKKCFSRKQLILEAERMQKCGHSFEVYGALLKVSNGKPVPFSRLEKGL